MEVTLLGGSYIIMVCLQAAADYYRGNRYSALLRGNVAQPHRVTYNPHRRDMRYDTSGQRNLHTSR